MMIRTVLLLSVVCVGCGGSGVVTLQAAQVAPAPAVQVGPPTVLASSSQYFERTFNRLVAAPPAVAAPVIPVAPPQPVFTVQPVRTTPGVVQPTVPTQAVLPDGNNPNVAIAIATAHAAAPVATILLPPYPFGPPQALQFLHPINIPDEPRKRDPEPTTTTQRTLSRQPENTTPQPNNSDNFVQGLPSNQNMEFSQYYAPPVAQLPLAPVNPPKPVKPIKLKTSVEIVPVPLTYIAPPPLKSQPIRHIHTFVPTKARIIIRPIVRRPARLVIYRRPVPSRIVPHPILRRTANRDVEPTTFSPQNRPVNKPPKQ